MAYLLLLVIFYQPIYWLIRSLINSFSGNLSDTTNYTTKIKAWFTSLWSLVSPYGL